MFIDGDLLFSDAQALTATAASTNYIDVGAARDLGVGQELYIVVIVDTAFTDASSDSTITVSIETDDEVTFTGPAATHTLGILAALSAAGTKKVYRIGPDMLNYRYAQLKYTTTNGSLTTGAVTAFITTAVDKWAAFADARAIDAQ
jgi:hypothetical protein